MANTTPAERVSLLVDAIQARATGSFDAWTTLYVTRGGSLMVASSGSANDDGRPHDLLLVHPVPFNDEYFVVLRPTVDPEFVAALYAEFVRRAA